MAHRINHKTPHEESFTDIITDYVVDKGSGKLEQRGVKRAHVAEVGVQFMKKFSEDWRDVIIDISVDMAVVNKIPLPAALKAEIITAAKVAAILGKYIEKHEGVFSEEIREEMMDAARLVQVPAEVFVGVCHTASKVIQVALDKLGLTQDNIEKAFSKITEIKATAATFDEEDEVLWKLVQGKSTKKVPEIKDVDRKKVEKGVSDYLSGKKAHLADAEPLLSAQVKQEIEELKQHLADAKFDRATTSMGSGFSHMAAAAARFNLPNIAKAAAAGQQMVTLAKSMKEVDVLMQAGAMCCAEGAAAGFNIAMIAASLVSMFADQDEEDGFSWLHDQLRPQLIGISEQIKELSKSFGQFREETRWEFARASYELSVASVTLKALNEMTQCQILDVRKAIAVGFDRISDEIKESARETNYQLEEMRFGELSSALDAVEHAEVRQLSIEELKKTAAILEKWMANTPCKNLVTGEFYASSTMQSRLNYMMQSSTSGRLGLLAQFAKLKNVGGFSAEILSGIINIDVMDSIIDPYMKLCQLMRKNSIAYDPLGVIWQEKLINPLENCKLVLDKFKENKVALSRAMYADMEQGYTQATSAIESLSLRQGQDLLRALQVDLQAKNEGALLKMQSPLWEYTREMPYHGGWCLIGQNRGVIQSCLNLQREKMTEKLSHEALMPIDLTTSYREHLNQVSLAGRFAEVTSCHPKIYLYPTYLPLEELELTEELQHALVGELMGLGRLEVQATLEGRTNERWGPMFYEPECAYLSQDGWEGMEDPSTKPFELSLKWSFVYKSGLRHLIQKDQLSLDGGADPCPGFMLEGGRRDMDCGFGGFYPLWNGDALSVSVWHRFMKSRRSIFVDQRPYEEVNNTLKRAIKDNWIALRKELFSLVKGDPFTKELFVRGEEKALTSYGYLAIWKEHHTGLKTDNIDVPKIETQEAFVADRLLKPLPVFATIGQGQNPLEVKLEMMQRKLLLKRQEILAIPIVQKEALINVDALVAENRVLVDRVQNLTDIVLANRVENAALQASVEDLAAKVTQLMDLLMAKK